jgi:hypothetical protein
MKGPQSHWKTCINLRFGVVIQIGTNIHLIHSNLISVFLNKIWVLTKFDNCEK